MQASSTGNLIEGNFIGTAANVSTALGNTSAGISISDSSGNTIGGTVAGAGNIIANTVNGNGVTVIGTSTQDTIESNSIYGNSSLGIDLNNDGVTPNALGPRSGPNNLQNYPAISSAVTNGTSLTVTGTLSTGISGTYQVELFWSPAGNASGYGEGKTNLGSISIATNAMGNASFSTTFTGAAVPVAAVIASTATDSSGNTSEFSRDLTVAQLELAPSGTNHTATTLENTPYTFIAADFGFSDPNTPPNSLLAVEITTLPTVGTLSDGGAAVTAGQFVSVADINAGKLVFMPATYASGNAYAGFKFQVQNRGGAVDPSPKTMTLNVTWVNQSPQGTSNEVTTLENTPYVFPASDFGFSDSHNSPPGSFLAVRITTLPSAGSLTDNGAAVTAGEYVSAARHQRRQIAFHAHVRSRRCELRQFHVPGAKRRRHAQRRHGPRSHTADDDRQRHFADSAASAHACSLAAVKSFGHSGFARHE